MHNVEAIMAMLIPIIAIVLGIGIAGFSSYLSYRKRREIYQLHHAERMAAIEKGIEVPPLPAEFFREREDADEPRPVRSRRRGLILLFVGIALTAALWGTGEAEYWWGLIPIGLGLAYLLAARLEAGERPKPSDGAPPR